LGIARQMIEPARQVIAQILNARRAASRKRLKDHHAADVHERALILLLELEESGIERRQRVRHGCQPTRARVVHHRERSTTKVSIFPRPKHGVSSI
jgi:hypothetical protein